MKIRTITAQDAERVINWSVANSARNGFSDPEVLSYPATEILCAENGDGPEGYLPGQLVLFLESFAPNPEATAEEKNRALYRLADALIEHAAKKGIREVCFLASDAEMAALAERLGFEKMTMPLYRLKVGEHEDIP